MLFQRPRVWIVESWIPCARTVVAARIQKLWPVNFLLLMPLSSRFFLKWVTSFSRESGILSLKMKNGPSFVLLAAWYAAKADTRHNLPPVRPR